MQNKFGGMKIPPYFCILNHTIMTARETVLHFCSNFDNLGYTFNISKRVGKLVIQFPRSDRPNRQFDEELSKLPIHLYRLATDFKQGKQSETASVSTYQFLLPLDCIEPGESNITDPTLIKFIAFCEKHNVKTPKDLAKAFVPYVYNINTYTRITKDKTEKRSLYNLKDRYIKFCEKTGIIDNVERQYNHRDDIPGTPDLLYRITIGQYVMWQQAEKTSSSFNGFDKKMINELYQPRAEYTLTNDEIEELYNILPIIRQMTNTRYYAFAGLDYNPQSYMYQ